MTCGNRRPFSKTSIKSIRATMLPPQARQKHSLVTIPGFFILVFIVTTIQPRCEVRSQSFRSTYQFTRFIFARARVDYDTLSSEARGQFLFGWTPNPGTALYIGYNDDLVRNGINPFTGQFEPGLHRGSGGRTFFIKMSYLFRKSFGS